MKVLTHGSLFAGIGGFDLGFERAGFKTVWQVEIDEYCRKVLARHFPDAERFADIRECAGFKYSDGAFPHVLPAVDVVSGGFPCQDISNAGKRAGIEGERSGLWLQMWRIVSELRPRFVVVENVSALLGRGMGVVLGDLAELGYDTEWDCLPASTFGAPHRRERVWIVAYPNSNGHRWAQRASDGATNGMEKVERAHNRPAGESCRAGEPLRGNSLRGYDKADTMADTQGERCERSGDSRRGGLGLEDGSADVADANRDDVQGQLASIHDAQIRTEPRERQAGFFSGAGHWEIEPNVGRVANGVPARVDRLKGLGNAVVPQIAEWIAKRILDAEVE